MISEAQLEPRIVTNETPSSQLELGVDLSPTSSSTFRRPWSDWSQVPPTPPAWAYGSFFALEIGAAGSLDDHDLHAFGLWQLPPLWAPSPVEALQFSTDNFDPIRRLRKWLRPGLVGHLLLDPTIFVSSDLDSPPAEDSLAQHILTFIINSCVTDNIALTIVGADTFSLSASLC